MPAEGVELLATSDGAWDDRLRGTDHDFYHHRGYHALAEDNGEGEAFLAVYAHDGALLAWPYLLRPVAGSDGVDVGCVYGYPGPVLARTDAAADLTSFLGDAWTALTGTWRAQNAVSAFTTFNPLLGNVDLARGWTADPTGPEPLLTLGRSVSIDLDLSHAQRLAGYEKETRYEIGRAHRAGLRTWVDSEGAHLPDLVDLYAATMHRNAAGERYLFSSAYFERLWSSLAGRGRLLVAAVDDVVVGVLLFVVHGDLAHAHLTGVSEQHLRLAPLNAMLDATADAAKAEGARLLHLGAGRGGREDSLFRFKRRIGDVERDFAVGRWVLDGPRYAALTAAAATSEPGATDGSFFPAYRSSADR